MRVAEASLWILQQLPPSVSETALLATAGVPEAPSTNASKAGCDHTVACVRGTLARGRFGFISGIQIAWLPRHAACWRVSFVGGRRADNRLRELLSPHIPGEARLGDRSGPCRSSLGLAVAIHELNPRCLVGRERHSTGSSRICSAGPLGCLKFRSDATFHKVYARTAVSTVYCNLLVWHLP